jgi:hypothetical protein
MTDSGPPYPNPNPVPGSNAIGSFAIGISPIGDIPAFNPYATIISQYSNSNIIDGIITSLAAALDLTELMDSFYDDMMNPDTAIGYGLDVIGRIVDVSRTLPFSGSTTFLGFNEASSWTGFGQGGFFSGGSTTTNVQLSDSDYRTLIRAKMAGNISDGSIPSINNILLTLFPNRGICYVADGLNMSLTYTFNFALNPIEVAIIQESGVLPNPTGVIVNVVHA